MSRSNGRSGYRFQCSIQRSVCGRSAMVDSLVFSRCPCLFQQLLFCQASGCDFPQPRGVLFINELAPLLIYEVHFDAIDCVHFVI